MDCSIWKNPLQTSSLIENEINLWLINLKLEKDSVEKLKKNLSSNEIDRANRFHFKKDKNSFIIARSSLRIILSKYLLIAPRDILFNYNKYGKPFLDGPIKKDINFNLSHSKDFALIGLTKYGKIGVDIEYINCDLKIKEIVNNYFSENEIVELFNLPIEKQNNGFFSCWTRKEAYIKAKGKGLSIPLTSFDVTLEQDSPRIARIENENENNLENWKLYNQKIDNNYCAAIANYGEMKNIERYYVKNASKL